MTLPRLACMPPCAAAECERFGGTSDKNDHIVAAPLRADADAQARESAADHQNVRVNYFHSLASSLLTSVQVSSAQVQIHADRHLKP